MVNISVYFGACFGFYTSRFLVCATFNKKNCIISGLRQNTKYVCESVFSDCS